MLAEKIKEIKAKMQTAKGIAWKELARQLEEYKNLLYDRRDKSAEEAMKRLEDWKKAQPCAIDECSCELNPGICPKCDEKTLRISPWHYAYCSYGCGFVQTHDPYMPPSEVMPNQL